VPPLFGVEVTHSVPPCTAGANRNRGSAIARGDVLIYQDADDLPHPQRVEIIAGLFEKYRIDHLMHYYYRQVPEQEAFSLKEAAKNSRYREKPTAGGITNGNPAIARSVLGLVQWPEYGQVGEDVEFNAKVYAITKWTAVTELPLLTYRHNLSSFGAASIG
jgi:glycosyltransferase involved in cell wall biosynthesis